MRLRMKCRIAWPGFELVCDTELPLGGVTAVFGESGSGKTTLLRVLAGLLRDSQAEIYLGEDCWQRSGYWLPTHRRGLGLVFQQGALFRHLDVRDNLEYGRKRTRGRQGPGLAQVIDWLGLEPLLKKSAGELSGGQRQRVALGRALLAAPRLLLLDEPLASLDARGKREILPWLDKLRREAGIPMLYVSHSPDEVARLADRLLLLEHGRITAEGEVISLLTRLDLPLADREDAEALLEAEVRSWHPEDQITELALPGGSLYVTQSGLQPGARIRVRLLARDVSLALNPPESSSILNRLPCVIREISSPLEGRVTLSLDCAGQCLLCRITARSLRELGLRPGMAVTALVKGVAVLA